MKTDTHPKMQKILEDRFKELSGEERVLMATSMFDTARAIVIDSLRNQNPNMTEVEIQKQLLIRFYGEEGAKVFSE